MAYTPPRSAAHRGSLDPGRSSLVEIDTNTDTEAPFSSPSNTPDSHITSMSNKPGCCAQDFSSTHFDDPLLHKAIRITSLVGLLLIIIQFGVGGSVFEFVILDDGTVRPGCWWVGLVLLIAALGGIVSANKGYLLVTAIVSALGIPIAIGGAAADGAAFASYTIAPMGCAQLQLSFAGGYTTKSPVAGISAASSTTTTTSTSASITITPSAASSSPPVIETYGSHNSAAQQQIARRCLLAAYASSATVNAGDCYCTQQQTPTGGGRALDCSVLVLSNTNNADSCAAIFSTYLPSLQASSALSGLLVVIFSLLLALCCVELCKGKAPLDGEREAREQREVDEGGLSGGRRRGMTMLDVFSTPKKWFGRNPLHLNANAGADVNSEAGINSGSSGSSSSSSSYDIAGGRVVSGTLRGSIGRATALFDISAAGGGASSTTSPLYMPHVSHVNSGVIIKPPRRVSATDGYGAGTASGRSTPTTLKNASNNSSPDSNSTTAANTSTYTNTDTNTVTVTVTNSIGSSPSPATVETTSTLDLTPAPPSGGDSDSTASSLDSEKEKAVQTPLLPPIALAPIPLQNPIPIPIQASASASASASATASASASAPAQSGAAAVKAQVWAQEEADVSSPPLPRALSIDDIQPLSANVRARVRGASISSNEAPSTASAASSTAASNSNSASADGGHAHMGPVSVSTNVNPSSSTSSGASSGSEVPTKVRGSVSDRYLAQITECSSGQSGAGSSSSSSSASAIASASAGSPSPSTEVGTGTRTGAVSGAERTRSVSELSSVFGGKK